MADASNSFLMHGAREAISSGLLHIEQQVTTIEVAVSDNPGLAFDLARTVIESTCRTILSDRNVGFDEKDDLPKLFKSVTNHLPFLPQSASQSVEARKSLAQTLNGLHTAVQGVCELRNSCGFASHGSDSPRPALETVQALLAAETADAIVGFLYRVHQQDFVAKANKPLSYSDNGKFNEYVDGLHDRVRIFDEELAPSRILFELAPEPYRLYLAEYSGEAEQIEERAPEPQLVKVATRAGGSDEATLELNAQPAEPNEDGND